MICSPQWNTHEYLLDEGHQFVVGDHIRHMLHFPLYFLQELRWNEAATLDLFIMFLNYGIDDGDLLDVLFVFR